MADEKLPAVHPAAVSKDRIRGCAGEKGHYKESVGQETFLSLEKDESG